VSITKKKYPTRGFASMPESQRRAIAAMGGRMAHRKGTAHQWTEDEARLAGSKGGRMAQARRQQARESLAAAEAAGNGEAA
jgi:hypothetical protein